MSVLKASSSLGGILDGVSYSLGGSATRNIQGIHVETLELTTAFTVATVPTVGLVRRLLIVNTGATEVKVRINVDLAGPTWQYYNIPDGRFMEFFDTGLGGAAESKIYEVAVRCMSGTGRAIVHQAWTE